jgi:signal transduction histidine kinase
MGLERQHFAWIFASVITVASFVGATAYTQNGLARLDALSSTMETNAVPSIEYLSRVAVRLTHLNQVMDEVAASRRAEALAAARQEVAALDQDVDAYLRLTPLSGENELWAQLRTEVNRAAQLVGLTIDEPANPGSTFQPPTEDQVNDALDSAVRSVVAALDFDVRESESMARDVRRVRMKTLRTIVWLDTLATVIALGAVVAASRASLRHDRLVDEHNALLTARVTELDRFAGRVAHDVLSPLGAAAAGLSLLGRSADERERTYIDRSQRALLRVQQLVDGLLTFARSGAHPDRSSTCAMDTVVATVVADCAELAEENGIALVVDVQQGARVSCASGVITSIVQNLVQNAIKYMGAQPTRRIVVRTTTAEGVARLEVEDTGPGIPPEIQSTLFEAFVRGPDERVTGTGLGLATVKRLVESHGGTVGVESKVGAGSLFRVELPLLPVQDTERPHV